MPEITLFTIGSTQKSAKTFFTQLAQAQVRRIVDVRLKNRSQLAGFTKQDDLIFFLEQICRIAYLHLPELAPDQELLTDFKVKKGDWKNYQRRFRSLMEQRRIEQGMAGTLTDHDCLLCSEASPEHCHRRLVAEYLAEHWKNVKIIHLL